MTSTNKFHYFFFENLASPVIAKAAKEIGLDVNKAHEAWNSWFLDRGGLFYHDQITQHHEFAMTRFLRQNNLTDHHYVLEDECLHEKFKEFCAELGYYEHYEIYRSRQSSLPAKIEFISTESILDWLEDEEADERNNINSKLLSKLIPAWFNSVINTSIDNYMILKSMPYQNYLKTDHWYRVRALTIFVFAAQCIGKPCEWNHEGMWMAYANRRHVHHISYKHRGDERFGYVCVLCDDCHRQLHKRGDDSVLDDNSIKNWLETQWLYA